MKSSKTFPFTKNFRFLNYKKAQANMSMPFGTIFALFLIGVFIVFAIMTATGFIDFGKTANVGMFYDDLQSVIDDAMRSGSSEKTFEIDLPNNIKKVCFANLSARITEAGDDYKAIKFYDIYDANIFLLPPEDAKGMAYKTLNYLDIAKITQEKNPYCVEAKDELIIKKDFYDKLVIIELSK